MNDDQTPQVEADIIEQTRFAQEEPILEDEKYGMKKVVVPAPAAAVTPSPATSPAPTQATAQTPGITQQPLPVTPNANPAPIGTVGPTVSPTPPAGVPISGPAAVAPSVAPGMTAIPTKLIKTVGIVLLILILLLIGIAMASRPKKITNPFAQPEASPTATSQTEMEKRVSDLQKQLESADPTKQDLVFPPIDLNIRLDKKTN